MKRKKHLHRMIITFIFTTIITYIIQCKRYAENKNENFSFLLFFEEKGIIITMLLITDNPVT